MSVWYRIGAAALVLSAAVLLANSRAAADDYGTVTGQFVLDGPIPNLPPLVKQGDATVKNPEVCSKQNVPDDSLIVDPKSNGIANVFVWMPKKPDHVAPELEKSKEPLVKFDQKDCRFFPHALILRTDQKIAILSEDPILHNTHVNATRNDPQNQTITEDHVGTTQWSFPLAERLPTMVNCDIHGWMKAWWLIVDHPYAAVSGKDGKFKIERVPAGTQEFIAWQEGKGWVFGIPRDKRIIKVTVKPGQTTDIGVRTIPAAAYLKK